MAVLSTKPPEWVEEMTGLSTYVGEELFTDRKGRPVSAVYALWLRFSHPTYARVGDTYLGLDNERSVRVSTVWLGPMSLGLRRPPFETMIFVASDHPRLQVLDEWTGRWSTLREAEIGHRNIVRVIKRYLRTPVAALPHRRHW